MVHIEKIPKDENPIEFLCIKQGLVMMDFPP
jgi:hypothetical protein